MKSRKTKILIFLFLTVFLLVFPFKVAFGIWDVVKSAIGAVFKGLVGTAVEIVSDILGAIALLFHTFLFLFIALSAKIANMVSMLNPFEGKPPVVETLWNVLKNFSYILLVFSGLLAAYDWLFGKEDQAKRAIFNIIIVALVINFTFVLAEEAFKIVRVFELGITNNQINKIGDLIAASFWQENPIKVATEIIDSLGTGITSVKSGLLRFVFYIFIIVFDILTIIVLVATILIFVVRYIKLIILTSVSSLATASILLPEFKGPLGEAISQFRFFDAWFGNLIKWLIVVPIFVMMVIIGGAVMKNVLDFSIANLSTESEGLTLFVRFITLFIIALAWYAMSLKVADNLSGGLASRAKKWVIGALSGIGVALGGLALGGVAGVAGRLLTTAGGKIATKVGTGGRFGWRSWVNRAIGGRAVEIGQKLLEKRYGFEVAATKEKIKGIDEGLRKTTDPAQIQNLTSQLSQLVQQYRENPYVLTNIADSIKRMSSASAGRALPELVKTMGTPEAPQEARESINELIAKVGKGNLREMLSNPKFLETFQTLSADVQNAFLERIARDFKETDVVEIMSKLDEEGRKTLKKPEFKNLLNRLNEVSGGFAEALLDRNIEDIAKAIAGWDKSTLLRPETFEKLKQVFDAHKLEVGARREVVVKTIKGAPSEAKEAIIVAAAREKPGGFLRTMFAGLSDKEINDLGRYLSPQLRNQFETIILEEWESQ